MSVVSEKLKAVRDLFAATHWMQGSFYHWDVEDEKARYCLIGGLRYCFGEPPSAAPDTDDEAYESYSDAVWALVEALDPYYREEEYGQHSRTVSDAEDRLIHFNDEEADLERILVLLDGAMARVPV